MASIQTDQTSLRGSIKHIQANAYMVHEITTSTGIRVREYVSPAGIVFGIAWQGQFIPNLQQLLGAYFGQYAALLKSEHAKHLGRRPLNIQKPGLVVQTGGHMRAYFGRAYIPALVPQGVTQDIMR